MTPFGTIFAFILLACLVGNMSNGNMDKCEDIESSLCQGLQYNQTTMPNTIGYENQADVTVILNTFEQLFKTGCSEFIRSFICMAYLPPCIPHYDVLPPCQELCRLARKGCVQVLDNAGFSWPSNLDCAKFPKYHTRLCLGFPNGTSTLPSDISNGGVTSKVTDSRGKLSDEDMTINLFLLITSGHRIQLLHVASVNEIDSITIFSGVDAREATAVDYYFAANYVFWASMEGKIFRGKLLYDDLRRVRQIVDTSPAYVESLAVDWLLGVIFWTEIYPPKILRSSLSGRHVTTFISEDLENPVYIAVDPLEGKLFWIDIRGNVFKPWARLESYDFISSRRKALFNIDEQSVPGSGRPKSLALDITEKKIFWIDAKSRSIHAIAYNGTNHKVLLRDHHSLKEPESLAVFGNHVVWMNKNTDTNAGSLLWANKEDGSGLLVLKTFESHPPLNLRIFQNNSQPEGAVRYNLEEMKERWKDVSSSEADLILEEDEDLYDDDNGDVDDGNCGAIAPRTNIFILFIILILLVT